MSDPRSSSPAWRRYLRFRGSDVRADVDDEIAFHIDVVAAEYVARGETPERALRLARAEFGDLRGAASQMYRIGERRKRRREREELTAGLLQDLRYAVRTLRATPAFSLGIVVMTALSSAALAAMFAVIDPLFVHSPARLHEPRLVHRLYETTFGPAGGTRFSRMMSYPRYADLRRFTHAFSEIGAWADREMVVTVGARTDLVRVASVSGSIWRMFDVRPVSGRFPADGEDGGLSSQVAVLSYDFSKDRFGQRSPVGDSISILGRVYRIVGVAPDGFRAMSSTAPAIFTPLPALPSERFGRTATAVEQYNSRWVEVIAHRRAGWSEPAAEADLNEAIRQSIAAQRSAGAILSRDSATMIAENGTSLGRIASVLREKGPEPTNEGRVALWLGGLAAIVLVISVLNVANLMLARTLRRQRELAIRLALGATRRRLMRLLFVEALALMTIGAAAALNALALAGNVAHARLLPDIALPSIDVTGRVVAFTLCVVVFAAAGAATAPAFYTRRWNVRATIGDSVQGSSLGRSRLRTMIVVTQAALCLALCFGAGLFLHSLSNVRALRMGYDARAVVVVTPMGGQAATRDTTAVHAIVQRLRRQVNARDIAVSTSLPFAMSMRRAFSATEADGGRLADAIVLFSAVSPNYFDVMGARIVAGRGFSTADSLGAERVTITSEPLATLLWPNESPIGKCLYVLTDGDCTRVIGVSEAMRTLSFDRDQMLAYYVPSAQETRIGNPNVLVRTGGAATSAIASIRTLLDGALPGGTIARVTTVQSALDRSAAPWRIGSFMLSIFALLALAVASLGVYAGVNFDIVERRHEIGIRLALGATSHDLLRAAARGAVRIAAFGAVVGSIAAFGIGAAMSRLLFHVSRFDTASLAAAIAMTAAASFAAALLPVVRAARASPSAVLRSSG